MIACIGEQLTDREDGNTEKVVSAQLAAIAGWLPWFHGCFTHV